MYTTLAPFGLTRMGCRHDTTRDGGQSQWRQHQGGAGSRTWEKSCTKLDLAAATLRERASESTDSRENRQTHVVKKFEGRFILLPFDTSVAVDLLFDLVVGASTCARAPP